MLAAGVMHGKGRWGTHIEIHVEASPQGPCSGGLSMGSVQIASDVR